MQDYFNTLIDTLPPELRGNEIFTASFSGEESEFVRFNRNRVRQAGSVTQRWLSLDLIDGRRHAAASVTLSGELAGDRDRLRVMLRDLRDVIVQVPEDPYLLYATEVRSSERHHENRLPPGSDAVAEVQAAGQGRDLVGIYAAGGTFAGFANSIGQRNWCANYSFNFDWSFHLGGDKAVKSAYAGVEWQSDALQRKTRDAADQLAVLERPAHTIAPGRYRVYLTPAAMFDVVDLLGWGGFGLRAHRTKATPFLKLIEGEATLHPSVLLRENTRAGIAPGFQDAGFIRPDVLTLIGDGRYRECLVSPRSAVEYQTATNGASGAEQPQSIDIAAGTVPSSEILQRLGTGIYIGNLWYLNYSDRSACRTTGMTRFATFWVENGAIQAPLNVMRFDETIYRMLGDCLIGLTAEREMIFDPDTYGRRSTRTARLPGALIDDFTLTL